MEKVVLITGASSGIGKEAALYFAARGWDVAATMRNPEKRKTGLENIEGIEITHLDVTDHESVKKSVASAAAKYGKIDAVVNNAGYAVNGPFEASSREDAKKQFDTNVTGLMDVCREVIPVFRKQKEGVIINISSMAGKVGFPLYSLYNSTKFAVEGFSEVLHHELKPFGIKVRLIEPGIIHTDFYGRSMSKVSKPGIDVYDEATGRIEKAMQSIMKMGSKPETVAKVIYKAAVSKGNRLRYTAGIDAAAVTALRALLPDSLLLPYIRKMNGL